MEQAGFIFDEPLTHIPASQVPPPRPKPTEEDGAELVERLRGLLCELPDDIELDDLLLAAGFEKQSLVNWHRARALDAILGQPGPFFQAYRVDTNKYRYRRLPPLEVCPGFEDETCTVLTRGGVRCQRHLDIEEESLWNFD